MRPRVLYFAVFFFFSWSAGRFLAVFLEHELHFANWMISAAIASQLLTSILSKVWLGGLADSWEASSKSRGKNRGRLKLMTLGLCTSTIATLLHSVGGLYPIINSEERNIIEDTMENDQDLDVSDYDTTTEDNEQTIPLLLFAYHLILRMLYSLGTSACMPALDGLTLVHLQHEGVDKQNYGKERMYGAICWGIAHITFGFALDYFGTFKIYYATTILSFVGCLATFHIYSKSVSAVKYTGVSENSADDTTAEKERQSADPDNMPTRIAKEKYKSKTSFDDNFEDDETTIAQEHRLTFMDLLRLIFKDAPILNISFIISLFTLFIGMAVVESLIFLYFEFLGGDNTMCGVTVIVTVLFEIPLFHFAPNVLRMLGTQSVFQLGCLAYVVRVIGYSFMPKSHPYLVLLLEPLHGVTISFANTASVDFADKWVPSGYESSGQGFISMIRSLGQFFGLLIAGVIEGRILYRILASIVTLGSMVLAIGNYSDKHTHHQLRIKEEQSHNIQPPQEGLQIVEGI